MNRLRARPHHGEDVALNGKVAQLVEQLAFNQLVLGSNPSLSTLFPEQHRFPVRTRRPALPKAAPVRLFTAAQRVGRGGSKSPLKIRNARPVFGRASGR